MLSEDEHQDIARSSYADMLNDDERNQAYNFAIKLSVQSLVNSREHNPTGDRFFNCCDIGTGSSLLSMMIVRAFQELKYDNFHIVAFEEFFPMATCATKVVEQNGMYDFITVLPMRSESYKDEANGKFDLLVAELLDTELIGEGCLKVYRHAVENLCSPTCLFVPLQARIYIEPVASQFLFNRHAIGNLHYEIGEDKTVDIGIPQVIRNCCGIAQIDDMQASMLREEQDFIRISEPKVVFSFRFDSLNSLKLRDSQNLKFRLKKDIEQPPVLIMWWDIIMCDRALIDHKTYNNPDDNFEVLSCAPTWARDSAMLRRDEAVRKQYGREVWREHWMQGVYYFVSVDLTRLAIGHYKKGSTFNVHAYHDSHSLWFDLDPCDYNIPPQCGCGLHRRLSRTELAFLSEPSHMKKLLAALFEPDYRLFPARGDFLSGPRGYESNTKWKILFNRNQQTSSQSSSSSNDKDTLSYNNRLCLQDLRLNYDNPWQDFLASYSVTNHLVMPIAGFTIKYVQVYFENLNRIRSNVGQCHGFDLSPLDKMINKSSSIIDKVVESHYLWEYKCKKIAKEQELFNSLTCDPEEKNKISRGTYWKHVALNARSDFGDWRKGWALAFWIEHKLTYTDEVISWGPTEDCEIGNVIDWNRYAKQMVYFLHNHPPADKSSCGYRVATKVNLDIGIGPDRELVVQRALDYNTSPFKEMLSDFGDS